MELNTHHRAKKAMGQNFLKSEATLNMMCEASKVNREDVILEIGPGKGALTSKLLEKVYSAGVSESAGKVIAVEKDYDLILILKEKFSKEISSGKLLLIQGDILKFNPKEYGIKEKNYKIVANIPYNITGAIIKKFLSEVMQPSQMTLLVQKEVAERIVARPEQGQGALGKESILSLSVKAYGEPKYMMKVSKRFFSPSPKVDSAIIAINNINKSNFKTKESEEYFFNIIKTGFAHKRKFAKKNLEAVGFKAQELDKIFNELNINLKARPENITLPLWLAISGKKPANT